MSGFIGFFDNKSVDEKNNIIKQMNAKITHRGPDGESFFTDDKLAVGFRLSVIEPTDGEQPVYNDDKNLMIFFDGRIYNAKEIASDLIKNGCVFKTNSDAEVVLRGYEKYGEKIASKLRGAFSFVIYNLKTNDLFGARDHFGVKPLYYYSDGN